MSEYQAADTSPVRAIFSSTIATKPAFGCLNGVRSSSLRNNRLSSCLHQCVQGSRHASVLSICSVALFVIVLVRHDHHVGIAYAFRSGHDEGSILVLQLFCFLRCGLCLLLLYNSQFIPCLDQLRVQLLCRPDFFLLAGCPLLELCLLL